MRGIGGGHHAYLKVYSARIHQYVYESRFLLVRASLCRLKQYFVGLGLQKESGSSGIQSSHRNTNLQKS